jgi:hypothetical protein
MRLTAERKAGTEEHRVRSSKKRQKELSLFEEMLSKLVTCVPESADVDQWASDADLDIVGPLRPSVMSVALRTLAE